MTVSSKRCGRLPFLVAACMVFLVASTPVLAATVQVDLDRSTAGIQSVLNVPPSPASIDVLGAVVVTGAEADMIGTNVIQVTVTDIVGGGVTLDPANSSLANGELPGAIPPSGSVTANDFVWTNAFPIAGAIGADGVITLVNFNLRVINLDTKAIGDTFRFAFANSSGNPALGIVVNGSNFSFGQGGENPAIPTAGADIVIQSGEEPTPTDTEIGPTPTFTLEPTPTNTEVEPTPTFTEVPVICADAGYYVETSFGQHLRVGNPEVVSGNASSGEAVFVDMELVQSTPPSGGLPVVDLAVLNKSGVVTFIENSASTPAQQFLFDGTVPPGFAVDVEVSSDSNAFWVLTEAGGIYRAGDANIGGTTATAPLGNDAADLMNMLPMPFGGDMPRHWNPEIVKPGDNASIRAVALGVVERQVENGSKAFDNANPLGFIVMDSQGGTYLYDGAGFAIRAGGVIGTVNGDEILNSATVYPFFPGLDIARDLELHPLGTPAAGLVIYDGWGGIHAVPNDKESPVRFLRNQTAYDPNPNNNWITTVGMPYLILAFDDPTTVGVNESASSVDVNSIFTDIEFCQDRETEGAYVMDKFGGIFAFGSTRNTPDNTAPRFTGSPYFYPYFYAEDMEPVLAPAAVTAPGPGK